MADKRRLMEEAKQFSKEGEAYIHLETKPNHGTEIALAGDMVAILCSVNSLCNRIAEKTGQYFWEIIEALEYLQGERENEKAIAIVDGELEPYEEDKLKEEIEKLEKRLEKAEEEKARLKMSYSLNVMAKEEMIRALEQKLIEKDKEILKLDHENEKLSNIIQRLS